VDEIAVAISHSAQNLSIPRLIASPRRSLSSAKLQHLGGRRHGQTENQAELPKVEADMFRAELEYRQAYARLKSLMSDK